MATFRDGTVSGNGLKFHYVEWGFLDAPPLLCLHGITQTAHSWDEVAEALSSDYRVICLDQRGHGDSDWAPTGEYNRQVMAADVDAVTDALGLPQFLLCGMSMGGINSITFTAAHPNKVKALVIVDVSPEIKTEGVQNIRSFIQASDELDSFDAFVERAHQFNPRRSLDNIRSRLSHNLKQLPSGKWTWKYDKALRSGERSFNASGLLDLWDDVAKIRCPTLILKGGESDILSSEGAEKLRAAIPGSQLAVIPGAGHSVMGDNPEAFVEAVRGFLGALRQ
jgi:pimeloyl-ACP methyl ester carboxylesterase